VERQQGKHKQSISHLSPTRPMQPACAASKQANGTHTCNIETGAPRITGRSSKPLERLRRQQAHGYSLLHNIEVAMDSAKRHGIGTKGYGRRGQPASARQEQHRHLSCVRTSSRRSHDRRASAPTERNLFQRSPRAGPRSASQSNAEAGPVRAASCAAQRGIPRSPPSLKIYASPGQSEGGQDSRWRAQLRAGGGRRL